MKTRRILEETARRNLDIIELVKQLDAEGRLATSKNKPSSPLVNRCGLIDVSQITLILGKKAIKMLNNQQVT